MHKMLVCLSAFLLLGLVAEAARADGVSDSIAELKALVQKSEDTKAIALMNKLADDPDERVTRTLVDLTECDHAEVACVAYRLAAPRKDPVFFAKLKTRVGNKKLAEASPKAYEAAIDALAAYADKTSLDALEDAMRRYLPTNAEFTTRIVRAFAAVHEKRVIEKLLLWMLDAESTEDGDGTAGASDEARANYAKAHEEIVKQLVQLTGQNFADLKAWKAWWKAAEPTFKFPSPPPKK